MFQRIFFQFKSYLPQIMAMLFLLAFAAFAWTEPTSPPPAGNVPAPLNIGSTGQTKASWLATLKSLFIGAAPSLDEQNTLGYLRTTGGAIFNTGGADTGLIVMSSGTSSPDITMGRFAYWPLDEGSGSTAVDIVGGHNGTLVNGAVWTTGKYGGAVSFDGLNDFIRKDGDTSHFLDSAAGTYAAWIMRSAIEAKTQVIVSKHRDSAAGFLFFITAGNGLFLEYNKDAGGSYGGWQELGSSSLTWEIGKWYHLVATRGSSGMKLYRDAVLVASNNVTWAFGEYGAGYLEIGSACSLCGQFPDSFKGLIDEVRIYNRELTAPEITELYNFNPSQRETGRVGIGTTDPGEKLEVAGNIKISGSGEIKDLKTENVSSLPPAGSAGRMVFNTTDQKMYYDDGASWKATGGSVALVGSFPIGINNPVTIPPEAQQVVCCAPTTQSNFVAYPPREGLVQYNGVTQIVSSATYDPKPPCGPIGAWSADGGGQVTFIINTPNTGQTYKGSCYYTKLE